MERFFSLKYWSTRLVNVLKNNDLSVGMKRIDCFDVMLLNECLSARYRIEVKRQFEKTAHVRATGKIVSLVQCT